MHYLCLEREAVVIHIVYEFGPRLNEQSHLPHTGTLNVRHFFGAVTYTEVGEIECYKWKRLTGACHYPINIRWP